MSTEFAWGLAVGGIAGGSLVYLGACAANAVRLWRSVKKVYG